jgi:sarcosine oxidase subunit delta
LLIIDCPWCGERDETEFSYGGEAGIVRPPEPAKLTDVEWADYLFMRTNARGVHRELWNHAHGCRRWFVAVRNTVTYRFSSEPEAASTAGGQDHGESAK